MLSLRPHATALLLFALTGCHGAVSPAPQPNSQPNVQIGYPVGTIELKPGGGWNGVGGTLADAGKAIPASKSITAVANARLMNSTEELRQGAMDLNLTFQTGSSLEDKQDAAGGAELVIRIPLSSSADPYGESRSCLVLDNGHTHFSYTAGLDEQNFVPFAPMARARDFQFPVNKYLCRALAAPFDCRRKGKTRQTKLPSDMSQWKIRTVALNLHGPSAAKAEVSKLQLVSDNKPFDYATCAKVAPSDGMCCVAHKETQWHCGTKPEGKGWHQVSGSCYHRETGASCSD